MCINGRNLLDASLQNHYYCIALFNQKLEKMKKLFFVAAAIALVSSVSSCKKCGYCNYGGNNGNSSSVCKNSNPVLAGMIDDYDQAKSDCQAQNGTWVVSK